MSSNMRTVAKLSLLSVGFALVLAACADDNDASDTPASGSEIFTSTCAQCHGVTGGGGQGPAIDKGRTAKKYSLDEQLALVRNGRAAMPAFDGRLSDDQIAAVVDYVRNELGQPSKNKTTTTATTNSWDGNAGAPNSLRGAPPELTRSKEQWVLPNRDYASSRAIVDSPINSDTVDQLKVAWTADIDGGTTFGNLTTTPLIVDGIVYVGDLDTRIHAIDLRDGSKKFTVDTTASIFGPTGVAVGWGKVFGTAANEAGSGTMIAAYDRLTGKKVWATDISANGGAVNIQPVAYDGLVYAATSGYGAGTAGTLYALDVETGAIVWSFRVVDDDNLWGHPEINSGGGAWYPPSIDPKRGLVYFGTSNPYPFPGAPGFPNGTSRPGDNKWTDSALALDARTGKLKWGHQAVAHDLFDRDTSLTARVDTKIDGKARAVLISTGKVGVVFGLDADTGEEIWSNKVGMHMNDDLTEISGPIKVLPGSVGGVETPIAVADDTVFVSVVNAPAKYDGPDITSFGMGVELGSYPGNLVALDVATGATKWSAELPGDAFGGATVVGDLVFTSTFDGMILAFDRATGEKVWTYKTSGGINGWPSVAGDTIVFPVGLSKPAKLVAFRLST